MLLELAQLAEVATVREPVSRFLSASSADFLVCSDGYSAHVLDSTELQWSSGHIDGSIVCQFEKEWDSGSQPSVCLCGKRTWDLKEKEEGKKQRRAASNNE